MGSLPIYGVLSQIHEKLNQHNRLIVSATPGAGKTTVIPPSLLEQTWLGEKNILLLQPRRMAAISAAERIAQILGEPSGQMVGYKVRFESNISPACRIEVMTEGMALRAHNPANLKKYGIIIFDEIHERNPEADVLLSILMRAQEDQPELRILAMSATLAIDKLAAYLKCPSIECNGLVHPVDEQWASQFPGVKDDWRQNEYRILPEFIPFCKKVIQSLLNLEGHDSKEKNSGDVLVFLPGASEIFALKEILEAQNSVEVLPLHGKLSLKEQNKALQPSTKRKIILATNIAETSLTIDGVTTVIDSGLVRRSKFDPGTGLTRIILTQAARDSRRQRAGRAGRTAPGRVIHLSTRAALRGVPAYTPPAILESDISRLYLQILLHEINPRDLSLPDPLPGASSEEAEKLLVLLGALPVNNEMALTEKGRFMATLPVSPRLGAMLYDYPVKTAIEIAALLEEGELLDKNASVIDLEQIYRRFQGQAQRRSSYIQRVIEQISRTVHSQHPSFEHRKTPAKIPLSSMLASAYPDRIAKRRPDKNSWLMMNGRGATLPKTVQIDDSELDWIIIADLGPGKGGNDVIRMLLPYNETQLNEQFSGKIIEKSDIIEKAGRIFEERRFYFGEILLRTSRSEVSDDIEDSEIQTIIDDSTLSRLRQYWGSTTTLFSEKAESFRRRVLLAYPIQAELGIRMLPDLSLGNLKDSLHEWALPYCHNEQENLKHTISTALLNSVDYHQKRLLDELIPEKFITPAGPAVKIDYSETPPVLPVKLQLLFGQKETPSIARGKIRLKLHLLSPAGRPVQITDDLAGFWKNTYPQVRKELRGRYPKHDWPENL